MSDNMGCAVITLAVAIAIAAIASCTAVERYSSAEERSRMTPEQLCVQKAWTQPDRMQCMGKKP